MGGAHLRIVALGDSTTAGTPGFLSPLEAPPTGAGNPESQFAYWMMNLRPEWTVTNCGINGETSGDVLRRLPRDVLQHHPDYVVILAGVNDVFRGIPPESTRANLTALYAGAHSVGIRVVAASILPYNSMSRRQAEEMRELNRWIRQVAHESGLAFCDTHTLVSDARVADRLAGSPDGFHPDVNGYRKMGEGLVRTIGAAESGTDP
ncbi:MAG: SGNH/GDSL hydrolase family protein [Thermoplasmata archaeon]|nr:SGNH/GDSL hydrolase family protein [Thermoplasmata archaeon]